MRQRVRGRDDLGRRRIAVADPIVVPGVPGILVVVAEIWPGHPGPLGARSSTRWLSTLASAFSSSISRTSAASRSRAIEAFMAAAASNSAVRASASRRLISASIRCSAPGSEAWKSYAKSLRSQARSGPPAGHWDRSRRSRRRWNRAETQRGVVRPDDPEPGRVDDQRALRPWAVHRLHLVRHR